MVKSRKMYSPQKYLELVTGNCYEICTDNDVEFVEKILDEHFGEGCMWTYDLKEIEHIVENEIDVVLVEFMIYHDDTHEWEYVYRWAEVTEDFEE